MKIYSYSILLLLIPFLVSAQVDTVNYSVVAKGKITGGQKVWKISKNEYHYSYQYNDRGRGDSITSVIKTNDNGLINFINISGVDYFKNVYSEMYSIKGDSAVWIVNGDRKAKKYNNQLYLSSSAPAAFGLVINWINKQPKKRVATLPDGHIHLGAAIVKNMTINGQLKKLKLFPVYFEPTPSPSYVWLTEDMTFFASVSSWSSHIVKGYENWVDTLFTIQEIASQNYYTHELKTNSKGVRAHTLFTHCNVFQSSSASLQKDMTVEVLNGKIVNLQPFASFKVSGKVDTVIDCKGKFLMPSLWDMHGHYAKEEGASYIAGGVSHIRDMGNEKILLTYKQQIEENKLLGPDVSYVLGFIDKEDPFQGPTGKIIKSLDEGMKAIDYYHQLGYPQIKLYSSIKPEWVKPMADYAHSLNMKVCGHIPSFMTAEKAINDGYDEMTHMNFMFLNFMGDTVDTRTPARFRLVGQYGGKLDLESEKVRQFIDLMKRKKIVLDPTLNVWQGMFHEFKGDTSSYMKPIIKWLPESWLSELSIQSPFGSDEQKEAYKSAFSNMKKMLKKLYDNGIVLVAGTDGGEANALHHELELYVQSGIPANEVLKIATYNAAMVCNLQNTYGEIKEGRMADFILIDGNPINNISDIRRVEFVVKNNRIYSPKQLLALQGWTYYY
jgi:hypothetical protein